MKFLNIVGTAREGRKSIRAARKIDDVFQNQGHETFFYDLKEKDIPPVGNRTYTDEEPVPEDIKDLREKVLEADCIVLVVPEYNHSYPGILKTALDYMYPEYDEKPFAYVTVSGGGIGGVRALSHLHDVTLEYGGQPGPDLPVSNVSSTLNEDGEVIKKDYEGRFESFAEDVEQFVEKRT